MLLDSNIIIYAAQPQYAALRQFIEERIPVVSIVNYVEVLGYHRLGQEEKLFLEQFFQAAELLPLSDAVTQRATQLRQQRKMSLGDAIIAGTALVYEHTLITRNVADFRWIDQLQISDPLTESD
jgi:predicted nucleic acid-binding protein